MTSNNEYYQDILRIVSGETISTYETTLNLMKKICLAYGCTYTDAQCSNKYLKDFAEASIGTTYSESKMNIEYLHDIAINFYPATVEGTENYYLSIIADYISVTPKLHTDLTIDVPLVLVYSDEFNITGVLTDENDDPVADATIELLIGNTIVDTATSNSQGQVSFTKSPVSMGNHTFQLRYNGDTGYYATTSSIVSRTINKETSVLNVSLPLDNANYYDYENIAVTGTLYDNDGDLIDNATVKVYNSSTLLESVNVSNGSFSISNLSDIAGTLGDYTLTIIYEGNDYYTASSITRTIHIIEEVQYDGISLTSDKSILSYYDSESATLTAQLKNGTSDVAVSGVAIEWFVDGVSKGSINTNNSGRSVFTYNSAGVGDVTIEAKLSSSVSETYTISDIYWYSNDGTKCSGTYSTGTDGDYHYITSIGNDLLFPTVPTGDFELSMKTYRPTTASGRALLLEFGTSKSDTLLCGWDSGTSSSTKNVRIYRRSGTSNTSVQNNTNPDYNNGEWINFKLRFENGTVTLTIGGTSVSTSRSSVSRIGNYDSSTSRLSEMQIRTL